VRDAPAHARGAGAGVPLLLVTTVLAPRGLAGLLLTLSLWQVDTAVDGAVGAAAVSSGELARVLSPSDWGEDAVGFSNGQALAGGAFANTSPKL
jgi:hypothetical protein